MVTKKKAAPRGLPTLNFGLLADPAVVTAAHAARYDEERARTIALAENLGIPDDWARWYLVALHLARQQVPELMEAKPEGAPKRWHPWAHALLAVSIERHMAAGKTEREAADALARSDHWRTFVGKKNMGVARDTADPGEALRRAYSDAKKEPLAKIARMAFKWHELQGTVNEWDAQLPGYVDEVIQARRK